LLTCASKTVVFEFVDTMLNANPLSWRTSPFPYVLSAEGATSTSAWGVAPGIRLQQQQALKARFNQPPIIELVSKVNRAFSPESFRGCPRFATANPSCGGLAMRRAPWR
jgi:hypothetical protein